MNPALDALLTPYTPAEQLYKTYQQARRDPAQLERFLRQTAADGSADGLYIPELTSHPGAQYSEAHMFSSLKNNITVLRHQRYTPPFSHTHTFFEMVYVHSGSCGNLLENGALRMAEGDLCILAPGVPHAMEVLDDSIVLNILIKRTTFEDTFFSLLSGSHLLADFFTRVLHAGRADDYVLFHTQPESPARLFLEQFLAEALLGTPDAYTDLLLENQLSTVFGHLLRSHTAAAQISGEKHPQQARDVAILQYLHNEYRTVTLESAAAHFGYTPSHMSRVIKTVTGTGFSGHILRLRCKKACALLTGTELSAHAVAVRTGFGSAEHFHRCFKKLYGCTPLEYRALHTAK